MNAKNAFIADAAALLLLSGAVGSRTDEGAGACATAHNSCKGENSCKGRNSCKSHSSCKGHTSCKSQNSPTEMARSHLPSGM
jgi:hypothetical protein